VTADITQAAPGASLQLSVQTTSTTATFYAFGSTTNNGITSLSPAQNGSSLAVNVVFKSPASLGVGTYSDTVTINVCYDQACSQPISNSPLNIPVTYVVTQPLPQINGLNPTSASAGALGFTLAVNGSNFQSTSQVLWNGSPRTTTYLNASQLTAQITAADIAVGGTANVQVQTGGLQSTVTTFTITPLAPLTFTQVSPGQVTAGGVSFYVSAIGTGFSSSSAITWNGTTLATTYISSTLLRAAVAANLIATTGTASVAVVNPASQGGTSATHTVAIVAPNKDATSYQINPAHTGAMSFLNLSLPSASTWSVDVGAPPSYAVIVSGHVFVTAANSGISTQLLALNATTGAVEWGPIALAGHANVTYDGGRLFVISGGTDTQVIQALDPATGNALWSANVPGGWLPNPPVAAGGIVYAVNNSLVAAFDETDGTLLWDTGTDGSSGAVAVSADGVYRSSDCLTADLQPASGVTLWTYNVGCGGGGGVTPVVADGMVYWPETGFSSGTIFDAETGAIEGTFSASAIPAFTPSTGFFLNNGTLQAQARSNNQVLWSFTGDSQLSSAPIVVNNYVFIGSANGNLYALDATSGAQVWTQSLGGAVPGSSNEFSYIYSGLSAGDGLLIVPNGNKVTAYTLSNSP
jgi:outer membrane protein assembly factor BamB